MLQLNPLHHSQAHQDQQVTLDHPANQEARDSQAPTASQELQDRRAHQDHPEVQEMTVLQASQDRPASLVEQERRVSAPSTVPSTAESSSRTVADAKCYADAGELNRHTNVSCLILIGHKFLNVLPFAITAMDAVARRFSGKAISKE